jgi:cytochrome c oxidase subunit IV
MTPFTMAQHDSSDAAHPTTRLYCTVFAALLVLLAITVAAAEADLGRLNFPLAAAIATIKAVLILLYFMHVRYSKPLIWLMAGAGAVWLAILFSLTFSDYLTRDQSPQNRSPEPSPAPFSRGARTALMFHQEQTSQR